MATNTKLAEVKYGLDGCKRGIAAARTNIKTFQEAIEKEEQTVKYLQRMMAAIQRKENERVLARKKSGKLTINLPSTHRGQVIDVNKK
jgi:hypothetical protein